MLTLRQYQILNSCCDDWEIFFFPFVEVNFSIQISKLSNACNLEQYAQDHSHPLTIPATEIIEDIATLVNNGFLECLRFDSATQNRISLRPLSTEELLIYRNYNCRTFDEHIACYGYGPYEFFISNQGRLELDKPVYIDYHKTLGYKD